MQTSRRPLTIFKGQSTVEVGVASPIMTVPEVSRYLKLSKSKVYYLVQKKRIPHFRIGRNVRIRKLDLEKWIELHLVN